MANYYSAPGVPWGRWIGVDGNFFSNYYAPTSSEQPYTSNYITLQLDRRDRAVLRAVAVVVIEEEKARIREIAALREQVAMLECVLAVLKGRDTDRR